MKKVEYEASSFRDPKGTVFYYQNKVFRYISESAMPDFKMFRSSGLSEYLLKNKKIIPFKQTSLIKIDKKSLTIECEKVKFISYPYEWSFGQYKDAALLTLDIMKDALKYKMWLKDASAYNIQFHSGKPVFIDIYLLNHILKDLPG